MRADENHIFSDELDEEFFQHAYDWMVDKMIASGLIPPPGVKYPVWAWSQWEGKRKRRDIRESGHSMPGEKIVQLTIEVADSDVLLSDFNLFHYPLNSWYLPIDETDHNEFYKECDAYGIAHKDILDFHNQTKIIRRLRDRIEKSWDRVFDLEREDDNYVYGLNTTKSIQATFWQLRIEQVIKAETFIAM